MSGVRVLVGTKKGAFILSADGKRQKWSVSGPFFSGWEIYHMKGSPADPNRLFASQTSGWFGQVIQRSDDGGKTWHQPGTPPGEPTTGPGGMPMGESNKFVYDTNPPNGKPLTTHQFYDGTQHPGNSSALACRAVAQRSGYGLCRHRRRGAVPFHGWRQELARGWPACAATAPGPKWQPGAGGMCLHTILIDPSNPKRMFVAISAAGAFRTDDAGKTWKPINRGLRVAIPPQTDAEIGFCVHRLAMHPSRSGVLFMHASGRRRHSDNGGDSWQEVKGNLPTDFGFPSTFMPTRQTPST